LLIVDRERAMLAGAAPVKYQPAESSELDHVELAEEWSLWRDFAVRSAGFPVEGLGAFGDGEERRLVAVARDPAFREAVGWQSRETLRHAVQKLAAGASSSPSRRRGWTDAVGAYWQRYCSKNDTIGYFGPLAWGSFAEDGDGISVRAGALERERAVHFETWAMEAVAAAAGASVLLPMDPFPERALRPLLADTAGLDRLEVARDAVAGARGDEIAGALDELDRVFEELTGRPAARCENDSGGGRTIVYLDCMRDLDLTLGPPVLDELRSSLPPVLYASRWWCGRVFDRAQQLLHQITQGRSGPIAPLLGELMGASFGLWDQLEDEQRELQRRWGVAVADPAAARGAFADWTPAWRGSCYQSADLQIAASSPVAAACGDFLLVLGDFHGGANPLLQGLFGLRHPDPDLLLRRVTAEVGPVVRLSPPRRGVVPMTARAWPMFAAGDVIVLGDDEPTPPGTRPVLLQDVLVDDGHAFDRAGTFRVSLAEFLWLPTFVAAMRSFEPLGHGPERAQIGRLVVRRATWSARAAELPPAPDDIAAWAREQGMPRRVFARSPLERKPRFVDLESPVLCRGLARFIEPARERAPSAPFQFTEMLPGPDECWLQDHRGHYTSELRVVALDRSARPSGPRPTTAQTNAET
jgi:hypothetical protein